MQLRYQALLFVWSHIDGAWHPRTLGTYRTAERAERRLSRVERHYTRYERRTDWGEVFDLKTRRTYDAPLNVRYDVSTVGDLGWTP